MKTGLKLKVPNAYVLLIAITAIATILTHIIPAGKYERVVNNAGLYTVDPATFHYIPQSPLSLMDFFIAIPTGLVDSAEIIFLILLLGGAFQVIHETKALNNVLGITAKRLGKHGIIVIPVMMLIFSLGGAMYGMAEEVIAFIPILIMLCTALGYDSLVGTAVVLAGSTIGFTTAFINPFTLGVAQKLAELPLLSGMQFRIVSYSCMLVLTIVWVMIYAKKIKNNPSASPTYTIDLTRDDKLELSHEFHMTWGQKGIVVALLASIGVIIWGVMAFNWYFNEISGVFFGLSLIVAALHKMKLNDYGHNFSQGMKDIASGALLVGFSRAILVVLNAGFITDTILYSIAGCIAHLPSSIVALGMYVFQCLLNFIIPSGSAQAMISMPIMSPLADLVGVTRQTAVLAFQYGDGISNILTPTSGLLMAGLAMAKIPWGIWVKWILPLLLLQYLLGGIFITIAHFIQLGPF